MGTSGLLLLLSVETHTTGEQVDLSAQYRPFRVTTAAGGFSDATVLVYETLPERRNSRFTCLRSSMRHQKRSVVVVLVEWIFPPFRRCKY